MSRFIKFVLVICLLANASITVYAAEELETNVTVTGYNALISGTADTYENTEVSITVVRPGKNIFSVVEDSLATEVNQLYSNVLCITQVAVDEENEFSYTCKFDSNEKSGTYTLRVQIYGEPEVREKKFKFENSSRKALGLSAIATTDANTLKDAMSEYATDIDIDSGEQYITFSNKEKEYVLNNILAETTDKSQKYIDSVGEIEDVHEMKALSASDLKTLVNSGSVIGVESSKISEYDNLTPFKKDLFISDFYTAIRDKEIPTEISAAFSAALTDVNTPPPGGNTEGGNSSLGGSPTKQPNSSDSVSVSGSTSTNSDVPYVIETPQNEGFTDMGNTQWAKVAVDTLYERGIINGKGENKFCPSETVTREEFLKMVIESLNIVGISEDEKGFNDVNGSAWYAHYVETGVGCGIINGISENEFGVGRPITREDMATILHRAIKYGEVSLYSVVDTEFTDNMNISEYAMDAVKALSSAKVINGMEDGSFMPKKTATRAEAAVMLYNLLYR